MVVKFLINHTLKKKMISKMMRIRKIMRTVIRRKVMKKEKEMMKRRKRT